MLEPEPLIEGDGSGVVRIDVQFQSREVQPVVGLANKRRHQSRSRATPGIGVVDGHENRPRMRPPIFEPGQSRQADDLAVNDRHQSRYPGRRLSMALLSALKAGERQLQGAANGERLIQASVRSGRSEGSMARIKMSVIAVSPGWVSERAQEKAPSETGGADGIGWSARSLAHNISHRPGQGGAKLHKVAYDAHDLTLANLSTQATP